MAATRQTRSDRLLRALGSHERIVVVTHDNPDPDAIASGWALKVLIQTRLKKKARLVGGGDIVRAENRYMMTLLDPPIELVDELDVPATTAAILVDCSFAAQNHLLAGEGVQPVAVIDHHVTDLPASKRLLFRDIRPNVAAAASIAASYLREQKIEPNARLATALYYAIRTETRGSEIDHSRLDRSMLRWLGNYLNPTWVAEIENAPLPRGYFSDLTRALANTTLYGDVAFCPLPAASGAETVGEIADLVLRCDVVRCVLCAAMIGGDVVVSVRTVRGGLNATALVRATLSGLGGGGGHTQRAGGKIHAASLTGDAGQAIEPELRRRWLTACNVTDRNGSRLVPDHTRTTTDA